MSFGFDSLEALRLAQCCRLGTSDGGNLSASSVRYSSITTLWGGMGEIYHVVVATTATTTDTHGNSGNTEFVVKYMDPEVGPHPSRGDQRKLDSYVVEAAFYRDYNQELLQRGVGLAKCLYVEGGEKDASSSSSSSGQHKTILCLSVLQNVPSHIDYYETTLEWLANFHAATWHRPAETVQSIGTYWHLDTRPDEHARMRSNKSWEGRLKLAARPIHEWLQHSTSIQSWVHGDAKDANVMWDGNKVCLCDFQYVGKGCPAKDLVYFLVSNGVADNSEEEGGYVDLYFEKLCDKLDDPPLRRAFDDAMELAYCDYQRFMSGWGEWGSNIRARVTKTLNKIDGGTKLGSEQDYRAALAEVFPKLGHVCKDS